MPLFSGAETSDYSHYFSLLLHDYDYYHNLGLDF